MFVLEAPYPAFKVRSHLPNPQFSDGESVLGTVSRKMAVDGTRYTYVKKRPRRKLSWRFHISRNKMLELRAVLLTYAALRFRITDHNDRVWIGYFTSNPAEFEGLSRAAPALTPVRGELYAIDLEFEGEEQ
jgi:hypothetical protein